MANPRDPLFLSFHLCWTQRNNPKSSGSSKYNPTLNQRDFYWWYKFLSHLDHIEVNLPVVASPAWYEPVPILLLLEIQMRPDLTFRNKNLLRWIDWGELPPGHPRLKKNQIIVQTKKKQDDRRRRSESGTEVNGSLFWLGGVPIVDDGPPRPFLHTSYWLWSPSYVLTWIRLLGWEEYLGVRRRFSNSESIFVSPLEASRPVRYRYKFYPAIFRRSSAYPTDLHPLLQQFSMSEASQVFFFHNHNPSEILSHGNFISLYFPNWCSEREDNIVKSRWAESKGWKIWIIATG